MNIAMTERGSSAAYSLKDKTSLITDRRVESDLALPGHWPPGRTSCLTASASPKRSPQHRQRLELRRQSRFRLRTCRIRFRSPR